MGYFSNGSEGEWYYSQYCSRCVHDELDDQGDFIRSCPIWELHLAYNYKECNNKHSMLHRLIPLDKGGNNAECRMFWPKPGDPQQKSLLDELNEEYPA